jgi:hypothetical protein
MYQENWRSVSLMRDGEVVVNPRMSRDKSVFAFNCDADSLPQATIIDLECDDFAAASRPYQSLFQSIRMLSCTGSNVWSEQENANSVAAVGIDTNGRVLFIHVREELPVHTVVDLLQIFPLDLERCMYSEGGAHAQLFLRAGDTEETLVGEGAWTPLPIPNVLGVARRQQGGHSEK